MFEMVAGTSEGRTFTGSRRVRLGDCSPGGRLRLDATARYLQDLSDDDTRDVGLAQMTWVVRRTVVDVHEFPTYLQPLDMVTWCSGIGSRWAERRVDIRGAGGPPVRLVESGTGRLLGTVDASSAHAQAHTGAVYLHQGETYLVDELDLIDAVALVQPADPDYSTSARDVTDIWSHA